MGKYNRKEINDLLDMTIKKIFEKENIEKLSDYEKRKIVFDYLVENKTYDQEYFKKVEQIYEERRYIGFSRIPQQEFLAPLISNKGICNGFSQVYKSLLEKTGIFAYCITSSEHQLNLVYDSENNTFSFDDVTSGIITKSNTEYFDLGVEEALYKANNKSQWIIFDETVQNYLMKRESSVIEPPIKVPMNEIIETNDDFKRLGINIKSKTSTFEQNLVAIPLTLDDGLRLKKSKKKY